MLLLLLSCTILYDRSIVRLFEKRKQTQEDREKKVSLMTANQSPLAEISKHMQCTLTFVSLKQRRFNGAGVPVAAAAALAAAITTAISSLFVRCSICNRSFLRRSISTSRFKSSICLRSSSHFSSSDSFAVVEL